MTLSDALKIAAQAKPIRRQPLDKLHDRSIAAAADALAKRYDAIGGTVSDMQKQLDRAKAGVELFYDVMKITPNMETLQ